MKYRFYYISKFLVFSFIGLIMKSNLEKERLLHCEICGLHSRQKLLRGEICEATFSQYSSLKQHMSTHPGYKSLNSKSVELRFLGIPF